MFDDETKRIEDPRVQQVLDRIESGKLDGKIPRFD
jgi:hypothetical protein